MKELKEIEKEIAYSHGFIETWLKTDPKTPPQILEHLGVIANGIAYYREQYLNIQEDLSDQQKRYAELTALSGNYLQLIQEQKELLEKMDENNLESTTPNISI